MALWRDGCPTTTSKFIGTYDGVEGDSASISVATAVISALEEVPVDQTIAMTGSLSVRGLVLPVGGVTAKIEAAAESGIRKVLIPLANMRDVVLEERYIGKIEIVPVSNMTEVLQNALIGGIKKDSLLKKLAALVERSDKPDKPSVLLNPLPLPR